jgi:hypothetical protein
MAKYAYLCHILIHVSYLKPLPHLKCGLIISIIPRTPMTWGCLNGIELRSSVIPIADAGFRVADKGDLRLSAAMLYRRTSCCCDSGVGICICWSMAGAEVEPEPWWSLQKK